MPKQTLFPNWTGYPLVGWSFDDQESLITAIKEEADEGRSRPTASDYGQIQYDKEIADYKQDFYDSTFKKVLFDFGLKFQLGGSKDKSRIMTTDKPQGIFDFSLASKGLYRVPEYYSEKLATDKPDRFREYETLAGVVPPNFVQQRNILGIRQFYFIDEDGVEYACQQYQKGTVAIKDNIKGAKLQFATSTKKVYLKFKRVGGKVNYVEIYSLFYYTSVTGYEGYALRHLPAIMVCQYFESLGIKCRFYATRFVVLGSNHTIREKDLLTDAILPMYNIRNSLTQRYDYLTVQPFLAKEYGEEFDPAIALAISQENSGPIYTNVIKQAQKHDLESDYYPTGGNPDWEEIDYRIGFERYKNKYQEYVKAGIFKGKEVRPEAQILFHSMSIKYYQDDIRSATRNIYGYFEIDEIMRISQYFGKFIEWWMNFCAIKLRDYILLLNTKEPRKEMEFIAKEMKNFLNEYVDYVNNKTVTDEDKQFRDRVIFRYIQSICKQEYLSLNENINRGIIKINPDVQGYILSLINDVAIYAQYEPFPTPVEQIEKMDLLAENLINELERVNI
jgi:hypothetical protein